MTNVATDWRAAGACLSADPDLFFPIATGAGAMRQITQAQRICAGCGVRQQCLEFAMQTGEVHGIWGGTTPEERVRAHRQHMRRRRAHRSWASASGEAPGVRAS
jgi:WhiB family transcriptional regulator, redox-sensing transcriptional regulator